MKHSMSEAELLRLADLNLVEFWCESSNWNPYPEIVRQRDMVLIASALEFPGCSFAFNLTLEAERTPDSFMARAKAFFAERRRGFSLLLRGHRDQSIIQYCRDSKMLEVGESPGMVLEKTIDSRETPAGAELYWVDGEDKLRGFRQVVGESYQDLGFPQEVSESYFAHAERVLAPHVLLAVVYLNGEPACTALAMLSHGIAGVYWVGTRKQARGRGLAEYCTRELGNAAFARGARKVILQASKYGEPIYSRMGYRKFTSYPWFICEVK